MNKVIHTDFVRACSDCVSFDQGECMNLVSIKTGDGPYEKPKSNDCCPNHKTLAEDKADDSAMALFRSRLGLPPRAPNEDFDDYDD